MQEQSHHNKFPDELRLKKRSEFKNIASNGKKYSLQQLYVRITKNYQSPAITKFGMSISKKSGIAVIRNRIKRLLREQIRQSYTSFPMGLAIDIKLNKPYINLNSTSIQKEIKILIKKAWHFTRTIV